VTTTEERQELMAIARSLMGELETVKSEFAVIRQRIDRTINKLLEASDELKLKSADEIERGESVTKKDVTYTRRPITSAAMKDMTVATALVAQGVKVGRTLEMVAEVKAKRACSVCREPGHRAQNCPNAHIVRAHKKAEAEAADAVMRNKAARKRGPVSPERKAQLAETLKKARAARGKRS